MAARELRNISGEVRALQDSSGSWHVVEPEGVYVVDARDERYYQTGEGGEEPIWADVTKSASKSKSSKGDE